MHTSAMRDFLRLTLSLFLVLSSTGSSAGVIAASCCSGGSAAQACAGCAPGGGDRWSPALASEYAASASVPQVGQRRQDHRNFTVRPPAGYTQDAIPLIIAYHGRAARRYCSSSATMQLSPTGERSWSIPTGWLRSTS